MKKIAILGSTGSIGTQTLEVVRNNPELQVVALAAGKSVEQMEQQIREFHPLIAGMWSEEAAADLRSRVADLPVKVVTGMDGLLEIAVMPEAQVLVTAIVGMIGIRPTIAAIEAGKDIALANKETLVTAGHIIMPLAAKMGVKILPVDSEHSAIFQSLNGEPKGRIEKILLTASGGPFRGKTREQLQNIQVEDALKHPNWSMGRKITIDSSTLVNKGLEVMEAKWLFGMPDGPERSALVSMLANHMKKLFYQWNKDSVEDEKILKDLREYTHGVIDLDASTYHLRDVREPAVQQRKSKNNSKKAGK